MKTIKLTQGAEAIVDDEDYLWLSKSKWYLSNTGYAVRQVSAGYYKQTLLAMHRAIYIKKYGEIPEGKEIDHINSIRLDNRQINLDAVTRGQNMANRKANKKSTSPYKGVIWHKASSKWLVKINVSGKRIHLGIFTSEIEAAKAYDTAAIKYRGEYARTNLKGEA
jgi:hypothetical protein